MAEQFASVMSRVSPYATTGSLLLHAAAQQAAILAEVALDNRAYRVREEAAANGLAAGRSAGADAGQIQLRADTDTMAGRVYNAAAQKGYLTSTQVKLQSELGQAALAHEADPDGFAAAVEDIRGRYQGLPTTLQQLVGAEIDDLGGRYALRVQGQRVEREREAFRADQLMMLDSLTAEATQAARSGNETGMAAAMQTHDTLVATMLSDGLMSGTEAASMRDGLRDQLTMQSVLGQMDGALRDGGLGAGRRFLQQFLADPPDGLDQDEVDRLTARMEAEVSKVEAEERAVQTRRDVLEYVRTTSKFSQIAQSEFQRLEVESDISQPEVSSRFSEFLMQERDRLIAESGISADGRIKLFEDLEETRFKLGSAMGSAAHKAQRTMVLNGLSSDVQAFTAEAARRPEALTEMFVALDDKIDGMAAGLTPEEEESYRDLGRRELTLNAIDGYMARGDIEAARGLIDSVPGLLATLPAPEQRRIVGAIARADQERIRSLQAAENKVREAEIITGGPLTASQRLRLAGLDTGDSPTVKVADMEAVLGRPLTDAEKKKALGLDGGAGGAQTDIGKVIQDREMFIQQFGADSEQVRAFDDAMKSAPRGDAKLSDEAGMRKEFVAGSSDFVAVRDAFSRIASSARNPSPAGDLALMFNYMKMLDPGSVVRESEFAQIAATGAYGERLQASAARFLSGERLTDDMRQDFLSRAQDLMRGQAQSQLSLEEQYRGVADRAGIDPEQVVIDFLGPYRGAIVGRGAPASRGRSDGDQSAPASDTDGKRRIRIDLQGNVIE